MLCLGARLAPRHALAIRARRLAVPLVGRLVRPPRSCLAPFSSMSTQQQHKAPAPPSPQPPVAANGTLTPSDREGAVEFVAISRSVHVYRPRKDRKAGPPDAGVLSPVKAGTGAATPSAVVIMGWMDAPLRIVSKYAAPYAILFPRATIIIKLSTGIAFMAGKEAREAALKGVIKVLEEVQASSEARGLLQVQVADLKKSSNQAGLRLDVDSQNRLQDESDRDDDGQTGSPSPAGGILVHSCESEPGWAIATLTLATMLPRLSSGAASL